MENKELLQAFAKFQAKGIKIAKEASNPFFKSKYANLEKILTRINPALNECGLILMQFPKGENSLKTVLGHPESGQTMSSTMTMKPSKNDPQGLGSALTYMRRYAICSVLCLNVAGEDDDGNAASKKETKKEVLTVTPELLAKIKATKTKAGLTKIFKSNEALVSNQDFINALGAKKSELNGAKNGELV